MRRKIRALAAEGKFSALFLSGLPVAIFILLNVVAPDFYAIIWNQSLTKMGLTLAATWMIAGNIVMYKMCNFRI
jgi:tight adherence protein B